MRRRSAIARAARKRSNETAEISGHADSSASVGFNWPEQYNAMSQPAANAATALAAGEPVKACIARSSVTKTPLNPVARMTDPMISGDNVAGRDVSRAV